MGLREVDRPGFSPLVGEVGLRGSSPLVGEVGLRGSSPLVGEVAARSADGGDKALDRNKGVKALDRAMRLLASRPHATAELRQKLRQRGYESAEIEAALTRLHELNLLDDAAFARSLIGWRSPSRGRRAIAAELAQRGVARDVAAEVLAEADPESELETARAMVAKLLKPPGSPEQVARVAARLQRRGFGRDTISSALRDFAVLSPD